MCNSFKSHSKHENHSKHETAAETDGNGNMVSAKYGIFLKGFSYLAFRTAKGWEKTATVGTEDEAKQKCIGILPQDDEQDA